jgi:hypothetical protein
LVSTWEKVGSYRKSNYDNAKAYIDELNERVFARRSNWRLPTLEELASLIERRYSEKSRLYIDPLFGDPAGDLIDRCWSADGPQPSAGGASIFEQAAWVVSFRHGMIMEARWRPGEYNPSPVYEFNYARAVSSPK